jgi:D-serine deaminase-like pyridoxal phosphate-dependent protein
MIKYIDTPALVVDLDQMENNIKSMAEKAKKAGIKLRPHTKTHKSPKVALKQIEAGADGITVAKLGEAEVMYQHGINDILIAYPIVGETKLKRLEKLAKEANIKVSLDSVEVAKGISKVGQNIGKTIPLYIEVDTGLGRVGRSHGEETLGIIGKIAKLPSIEIQGLMTHAGHSYKSKDFEEMKKISLLEGEYLVQTKELVKERIGIQIPVISVGSTPTSYIGGQIEGVNEMRPGTYVFNDATLLSLGLIHQNECALTIHSTVISRPSSDRAIIDAGSKTLTSDKGLFTEGHGFLKENPDVTVSWLSEEHGVIYLPDNFELNIGDVVEIVPNHVCPTVNLTDELIGIRNGKITEIIEVAARGKNK